MLSSHQEVSNWAGQVSSKLPSLSKSQAWLLAVYGMGVMLTHSCGVTTVAAFMGQWFRRKEGNVRQQLRELTYEVEGKRGKQRQALVVSKCFGDLVRWVLSRWVSDEPRLALALDATSLKDVFTVLVVSVVYRGCAIPVAWQVLGATDKKAWMPHWEHLLECLRGSVPSDWKVVVLADRGLYSPRLFKAITANAWHPFLRVNQQGLYRLHGQSNFHLLSGCVHAGRTHWSGHVHCFKTAPLECTLLARFDPAYTDPWLIVTDLPPVHADVAWYSLRFATERGFKTLKRAGWHWERTHMSHPERANRLWLVCALATFAVLPHDPLDELDSHSCAFARFPRLSPFKRGLLSILLTLISSTPLSLLGPLHSL